MQGISKVSEITYHDVADYCRISEISDSDQAFLNNCITYAKSFIKNYTGRSADDLDKFEDFVIVVFILCQDMYDNRTLYVDKTNINKVVENILGMHSVNLL